MNTAKLWWGRHPTILCIGMLSLICALMIAQKFFRFGGSPDYELGRSLFYNFVVMVPFAPCVALGLLARQATSNWRWRHRVLAIATLGVVSIALYVAVISGVLYALGMSTDWLNQAFLSKYISGPMHIHAAFFILMMFVQAPLGQPASGERTTATPESERYAAVFGIPLDDVLSFEAEDHYVWIHQPSSSVLKRMTIRKLMNMLPQHFMQVHRSHIVNLNHVDRVIRRGRKLELRLGDRTVPVSVSRRAELSERLPGK